MQKCDLLYIFAAGCTALKDLNFVAQDLPQNCSVVATEASL